MIRERLKVTSATIEDLTASTRDWSKETNKRLETMSRDLAEILGTASGSARALAPLDTLVVRLRDFIFESQNHERIKHILQSLHFQEIQERHSEVKRAHMKTFEWSLAEDSGTNLASWLRTGSGIYWYVPY
jgi:hypothetical protein